MQIASINQAAIFLHFNTSPDTTDSLPLTAYCTTQTAQPQVNNQLINQKFSLATSDLELIGLDCLSKGDDESTSNKHMNAIEIFSKRVREIMEQKGSIGMY